MALVGWLSLRVFPGGRK